MLLERGSPEQQLSQSDIARRFEQRAKCRPMAAGIPSLDLLRMKYNAAYAAYKECVRALNDASMSGESPSALFLEKEADALHELTEARANLLAAMRAR